jgi:hypothetical protein
MRGHPYEFNSIKEEFEIDEPRHTAGRRQTVQLKSGIPQIRHAHPRSYRLGNDAKRVSTAKGRSSASRAALSQTASDSLVLFKHSKSSLQLDLMHRLLSMSLLF